MLNLIDNYMQRIDGKVPDSWLRLLRDELSELLMHYTIQPVSTELTVYEGYIPSVSQHTASQRKSKAQVMKLCATT